MSATSRTRSPWKVTLRVLGAVVAVLLIPFLLLPLAVWSNVGAMSGSGSNSALLPPGTPFLVAAVCCLIAGISLLVPLARPRVVPAVEHLPVVLFALIGLMLLVMGGRFESIPFVVLTILAYGARS